MKVIVTVIAVLIIVGLAISIAVSPAPVFIWNKTDSVQKGLYMRNAGPFERGSIVAVMPTPETRRFISDREYLPDSVPLLKRVFAGQGAEICRLDENVFINNFPVAKAQSEDKNGRKMPAWQGCFTLKEGQYFLLNAHPESLDGRYFGATNADEIIGKYEKFP